MSLPSQQIAYNRHIRNVNIGISYRVTAQCRQIIDANSAKCCAKIGIKKLEPTNCEIRMQRVKLQNPNQLAEVRTLSPPPPEKLAEVNSDVPPLQGRFWVEWIVTDGVLDWRQSGDAYLRA